MKSTLVILMALAISLAPLKQTQAADISTSVVVGAVVANYAGVAAGVAVSSLLAGTELTAASKETALKAAQNDIQAFRSTGELTAALENSINEIQSNDESISSEEAMSMILESLN